MRNPVQKMLKSASQMKNNPQLAQRAAQGPDKVNALAAQIVMPEQQAMQNSKPIPNPIGSVLMQRLQQAKQAAAMAKQPDPREGGIVQALAKGGSLRFVKGGRAPKNPLPEDLITSEDNSIQSLAERIKENEREARNVRNQKAELGLRGEPMAQKSLTSKERKAKAALAKQSSRMDRNAAAMDKAMEKVNRGIADETASKRAAAATERQKLGAMGQKLKEQANTPASKTPQGQRPVGRAASPDYRAQGIEQGLRQKARTAEVEKTVGSGLANQNKRGPGTGGKAPAYDISSYGGATRPKAPEPVKGTKPSEAELTKRKEAKYAADKAAEESGAEPKKVSKEAQAYKKERLGSEARLAESTSAGKTFEEEGVGRKRYRNAPGPSKKMAVKTPAGLMDSLTSTVKGFLSKNPDLLAEARKVATDVVANNPEASIDDIGRALKGSASPEIVKALQTELDPILKEHGVSDFFSRAKSGIKNVATGAVDKAKMSPGKVGAGLGFAAGVADKLLSRGEDATMEDVGGALVEGGKEAITGAILGKVPYVGQMYNAANLAMPFYERAVPEETRRQIAEPGVKMLRGIEHGLGEAFDKYFPGAHAAEKAPVSKDAWLEQAGTPEGARSFYERMAREQEEPVAPPAAPAAPQAPASAPAPKSEGISTAAPQVKPSGGGIAAAPETASLRPAPEPRDMYAGDTSQATPEGAIEKLMALRGPSYQYSPEVMNMLKENLSEDRGATLMSMLGATAAGLANRDRYAGAHDAALLAGQAFTSGREREAQAKQAFLQGVIHNEQVPVEQRQAAFDTYTKMQMAAAQNAALMARANLAGGYKLDAAQIMAQARALSGQGSGLETERKGLNDLLDSLTVLRNKAAEQAQDTSLYDRRIEETMNKLRGLVGIAGDQGLGQTTPITTLKM